MRTRKSIQQKQAAVIWRDAYLQKMRVKLSLKNIEDENSPGDPLTKSFQAVDCLSNPRWLGQIIFLAAGIWIVSPSSSPSYLASITITPCKKEENQNSCIEASSYQREKVMDDPSLTSREMRATATARDSKEVSRGGVRGSGSRTFMGRLRCSRPKVQICGHSLSFR